MLHFPRLPHGGAPPERDPAVHLRGFCSDRPTRNRRRWQRGPAWYQQGFSKVLLQQVTQMEASKEGLPILLNPSLSLGLQPPPAQDEVIWVTPACPSQGSNPLQEESNHVWNPGYSSGCLSAPPCPTAKVSVKLQQPKKRKHNQGFRHFLDESLGHSTS